MPITSSMTTRLPDILAATLLAALAPAATAAARTLSGSNAAEALTGSEGPDKRAGAGGADRIRGLGGDDRIKATSGARSTVQGGDGNDTITAIIARGKAVIHCGPGVDTVIESAYAGNRKRVKLDADCENRKRG